MTPARSLWVRVETLHAVTYFSDESRQAARDAGLRGFWMGYFGLRAAPLGPVPAAVVGATFAGFAPAMVARAVPDAWARATPAELVVVRAAAGAAALRRLVPGVEALAIEVGPPLAAVVAAASPLGRPLFAANVALDRSEDPVAHLWQLCTSVREHRGDGHVLALGVEGLDGCEAHVLHATEHHTPAEVLRDSRGWTAAEWDAAQARLAVRGLVDDAGLTADGRALRARVEHATDRLAAVPVEAALGGDGARDLGAALLPAAATVAAGGIIPYPNPMGLPRADGADGDAASDG